MADNLYYRLQELASQRDVRTLLPLFQAEFNAIANKLFTSAGLAITGAGSPTVKAGNAIYGQANSNGVQQSALFTKAANTAMPALVGTVNNGTFNVFVFSADSAGNLYSAMGTAATTFAAVKFPPVVLRRAYIGFIVVNPTGTGNFVGGTTALDDATVVPNVVYINSTGVLDQNAGI